MCKKMGVGKLFMFLCLITQLSCKKELAIETEKPVIQQMKTAVQKWYGAIMETKKNAPDFHEQVRGKAVNITDEPYLPAINIKNWSASVNSFDTLGERNLMVPIYFNNETGEYIQLAAMNNEKSTGGLFLRTVPDSTWYSEHKKTMNFNNLTGKIVIYDMDGIPIGKTYLKNGSASTGNESTIKSFADCADCTLREVIVSSSRVKLFTINYYLPYTTYLGENFAIEPYVPVNMMSGSGSAGANAATPESIIFAAPNAVVPVDINKILKCLGAIKNEGATYSVKLCVDVPDNNNPGKLWNTTSRAGHVFLELVKANGPFSVTESIGFYPEKSYKAIGFAEVNGELVNDGDNTNGKPTHEYNASLTMDNLSERNFNTLIQSISQLSANKYDLNNNNCAHFALNVINSIRTDKLNSIFKEQDISTPINYTITSYMKIPFSQSPAGLYEKLMQKKQANDKDAPKIEIGVNKEAKISTINCN